MSEIIGIIGSWGIEGALGIGGCYLVVSSIIGRMLPIGKYIHALPLRFRAQLLLGVFGCVLATPMIWSLYAKLFYGADGRIFSSPNEETYTDAVASPKINDKSAVRYLGIIREAEAQQFAQVSCPVVIESFGLDQKNIRRLKSRQFKEQVFVYVGDIHALSRKPTTLSVIIGDIPFLPASRRVSESEFKKILEGIPADRKFNLSVKSKGESKVFNYAGRRYRLTVTEIYAVLLGDDKIAVSVCRESPPRNG